MKSKVRKTLKIFFFYLLFAVACGCTFAAFLLFLKADAEELSRAVEGVAAREAEEQGKIQVSNLYEESKAERAELAQFVLTEDRLIDFVSEIERIAGQQQVNFETRQIRDVSEKKEVVGAYVVDVTFSGSQTAVRNMIKIIETLPYHGTVGTMNVSRVQRGWEANMSLQLTVIAYD